MIVSNETYRNGTLVLLFTRKVDDPVTAAYAVEDVGDALIDIAASIIHYEFGRIQVDSISNDLEHLWEHIARAINEASAAWGTRCVRFATTGINLPSELARTYEELAQARLRQQTEEARASGDATARDAYNEMASRQAMLQSESRSLAKQNDAHADAEAIMIRGDANAGALHAIAEVLERPAGRDAARVWIASKYIDALTLGFQNKKSTLNVTAAGPAQIVDEALNIMEGRIIRSRSASHVHSGVESSVSSPSPTPDARPTPPSHRHSEHSHSRRQRPRDDISVTSASTSLRNQAQSEPPEASVRARKPDNARVASPPRAKKPQHVQSSERSLPNGHGSDDKAQRECRKKPEARKRTQKDKTVSSTAKSNAVATKEPRTSPTVNMAFNEVRAEAVSASALSGWGTVTRRSRKSPAEARSQPTQKKSSAMSKRTQQLLAQQADFKHVIESLPSLPDDIRSPKLDSGGKRPASKERDEAPSRRRNSSRENRVGTIEYIDDDDELDGRTDVTV